MTGTIELASLAEKFRCFWIEAEIEAEEPGPAEIGEVRMDVNASRASITSETMIEGLHFSSPHLCTARFTDKQLRTRAI